MYSKRLKSMTLSLMIGLMVQLNAKELSPEQLKEEKVSYTFLNEAGDSLWDTPGNWRKGKFKAEKSTELPSSQEDLLFIGADLEIINKQVVFKSLFTGFHRDSSLVVDRESTIKADRLIVGFVKNKKHKFNNKGKLELALFSLKNGTCHNEGRIVSDNFTVGRKDSQIFELNNSGQITANKIFAVNMNESGKMLMTAGFIKTALFRASGKGQLSLQGGKMILDNIAISDGFRIDIQGSAKIVINKDIKLELMKRMTDGYITGGKGLSIYVNKKKQTVIFLDSKKI